jgi:hypothetical protein
MTDDFRRYPAGDKRQLINFTRFTELTGNKIFICLDRGILEICKYFINSRGSWRTTYYVENQQAGYLMPTMAEFQDLLEAIAEANLDMASCDDIVTALEGISASISASSTTSGGSGCGCVLDPGTDITDTYEPQPASEPDREGDPPAGFETWEAFDAFKCNAIGWFLDGYIGTLLNWGGLFGVIGGLTVAVVVGLCLLIPPAAALITIVAALGVIFSIDASLFTNFVLIAEALQDERDDIICELYGVDNAADAFDIMSAHVESAISGLSGLPPGVDVTMSVCCTQLISTTYLNVIYTGQGDIEGHTGEDCSACVGADCLFLTYGFILSIEPAEGYDGVMHVRTAENAIAFGCDATEWAVRIECPCNVEVHIEDVSGSSTGPVCDRYYVYDVMDSIIQYNSDTWSDTTIPAGGGLYIFTSGEDDFDIFFTNV